MRGIERKKYKFSTEIHKNDTAVSFFKRYKLSACITRPRRTNAFTRVKTRKSIVLGHCAQAPE